MFTVSLRRFRLESIGTLAALASIAALALVTGTMMSDHFHDSGLSACLATAGSGCELLRDEFGRRFASLELLILPLGMLPALLGALVGGPLVARELELGAHRFLWTQGCTRERWFATMSAGATALATVAGMLYAAIAARWLDVTNRVTGERFRRLYDFQGVLPVAATVFAVAVGIACGVVLRRTVPAAVATIGIFVVVRLVVATQLRPRFATPLTRDAPGFSPDDPTTVSGDWILSQRTLTADGTELGRGGSLDLSNIGDRCPALELRPASMPDGGAMDGCLDALGVHQLTRYHPADRFWTFQLIESGIMLAVAALAIGVAVTLLPRRAV